MSFGNSSMHFSDSMRAALPGWALELAQDVNIRKLVQNKKNYEALYHLSRGLLFDMRSGTLTPTNVLFDMIHMYQDYAEDYIARTQSAVGKLHTSQHISKMHEGLEGRPSALKKDLDHLLRSYSKLTRVTPGLNVVSGVLLVGTAALTAYTVGSAEKPDEALIEEGMTLAGAYLGSHLAGKLSLTVCPRMGPYMLMCGVGLTVAGGLGGAHMTRDQISSIKSISADGFNLLDLVNAFIPEAKAAGLPKFISSSNNVPISFISSPYKLLMKSANLLEHPSALEMASPLEQQIASHLKRDWTGLDSHFAGLFDDTTKNVRESELYQASYKPLSGSTNNEGLLEHFVTSKTFTDTASENPAYDSGQFINFLSEPLFESAENLSDEKKAELKRKGERAKELFEEIEDDIENGRETSDNKADELLKLITDKTSPAHKKLIDDLTTETIEGFEDEETVTKLYEELHNLKQSDASEQEIIEKSSELKNEKVRIDWDRYQLNKVFKFGGYASRTLSILGRVTNNPNFHKAAVFVSETTKIIEMASLLAKTASAAAINPYLALLTIAESLLSIAGIFGDDKDPAMQALMKGLEQLSKQIDQLRTEMHARFDEVMNGLDLIYQTVIEGFARLRGDIEHISGKLNLLYKENKIAHRRTISYLQTIVRKLMDTEQKRQLEGKIEIIEEILKVVTSQQKHLETSPENQQYFDDLRSELSTRLTSSGTGIRHTKLTGADSPTLDNPVKLKQHIDSFISDFHLGTLAKLFAKLDLPNKQYSPKMVDSYLKKILANKANFYRVPCLTIADLVIQQHEAQIELFGLEKHIQEFLSEKNNPDLAIIPIKLQAKWQLIVVNKPFQTVDVFTTDDQPELMERMLKIIRQSLPESYDRIRIQTFNQNILPVHYGPIIVEIVKYLSEGRPYDDIIFESSNDKLDALYEDHIKNFKPSSDLLARQAIDPRHAINPWLTQTLTIDLLNMLYHKYPDVSDEEFLDLTIDKVVIDDIRKTMLALEYPYELYQALLNEDLIKTLFKRLQKSTRTLQESLEAHRADYESGKSVALNLAASEYLTPKYQDEEAIHAFHKDIEIKTYGNWFNEMLRMVARLPEHMSDARMVFHSEVVDRLPEHMSDARIVFFSPEEKLGEWVFAKQPSPMTITINHLETVKQTFINEQKTQIKNFKINFFRNYTDPVYNFRFDSPLNLYDQRAYFTKQVPLFILPEQEGNPVLPSLLFLNNRPQIDLLVAQGFNLGNIELSYRIDDANNLFIINIHFLRNNRDLDSCVASYSIQYIHADESLSFYQGQEAIWWFWVGGKIAENNNLAPSTTNKILPGVACYPDAVHPNRITYIHYGDYGRPSYHRGYLSVGKVDRPGAGYLPLSRYTKLTNHTEELPHPLILELQKQILKKYAEMQTEHNERLSTQFTNDGSTAGEALVTSEATGKALQLLLSFIFPGSMSHPESRLYSMLYNERYIYNENQLLATLKRPMDHYVADDLIPNKVLEEALALCLSMLSIQAHNPMMDIDIFQAVLLDAYDDFIPYQFDNQTIGAGLRKWNRWLAQLSTAKGEFSYEELMYFMTLSPEEQQQEKTKILRLKSYITRAQEYDQEVQSGKLSPEDALDKANKLDIPEFLSDSPSTTKTPQTIIPPQRDPVIEMIEEPEPTKTHKEHVGTTPTPPEPYVEDTEETFGDEEDMGIIYLDDESEHTGNYGPAKSFSTGRKLMAFDMEEEPEVDVEPLAQAQTSGSMHPIDASVLFALYSMSLNILPNLRLISYLFPEQDQTDTDQSDSRCLTLFHSKREHQTVHAFLDSEPKPHPETGRPVFTLRSYDEHNRESGHISLYDIEIPCRSPNGKTNNVLESSGELIREHQEIDLITAELKICQTLPPPTLSEKITDQAKQSGWLGAMRGASHLVQEGLEKKGVSRNKSWLASKAVFYGGFFATSFTQQQMAAQEVDPQNGSDWESTLHSFYHACAETGSFAAFDIGLTIGQRLLHYASSKLKQNDWQKTGAVVEKASACVSPLLYLKNASENSFTMATTSLVSGIAAEKTVETVGFRIMR